MNEIPTKCPVCEGQGFYYMDDPNDTERFDCQTCKGTGLIHNSPSPAEQAAFACSDMARRHGKPTCAACGESVEMQDSVWCPRCGANWRGDHHPPTRSGAMPPSDELSDSAGESV